MQERVDARACRVASARYGAPERVVVVERRPELFVEDLELEALSGGLPEQPVLDEVGREQGGAVGVQRLEDRLRLISLVEIEDDQPYVLLQGGGQDGRASCRGAGRQPSAQLAEEIGFVTSRYRAGNW